MLSQTVKEIAWQNKTTSTISCREFTPCILVLQPRPWLPSMHNIQADTCSCRSTRPAIVAAENHVTVPYRSVQGISEVAVGARDSEKCLAFSAGHDTV